MLPPTGQSGSVSGEESFLAGYRHETIFFAHLRSGTFECDRTACRYANQRFVVHEVSNPAIEIFIDQWRNFETTLMKRCNCVPARFVKTRAVNLTIFTT